MAERPTDAHTASELANQTAEPMLPAEWWLIGTSLALGVVLLGLLLWVSQWIFPAG